jgi:hypothetical protein
MGIQGKEEWNLKGKISGMRVQSSSRYARVIIDISFKIILIEMMAWNIRTKIIDIETVFLHGDTKWYRSGRR